MVEERGLNSIPLVEGPCLGRNTYILFQDTCPMRPQSKSASWDMRQSGGSAKNHVSHEEADADFLHGT